MTTPRILIVEDDSYMRNQLKELLKNDYQVFTSGDRDEALSVFKYTKPDLVLLDLYLPPDIYSSKIGMDILQRILEIRNNTKVIVITGSNDNKDALSAVDMGVYAYITKPFNIDDLKVLIKGCLYIQKLERENKALHQELEKRWNFEGIIGNCPQMCQVFSIINKAAPTDYTILIEGETGVGKELIARALHSRSPRKEGPFIVIDCTVIPEGLLESELFGYEKGSFTGAYRTKRGKIELAEKGTLFLDEIGDLPISLQAKFLRFLEESKIQRIGGVSPKKVNTRVIAATNKDLKLGVTKGSFREDLYHRLNMISIKIPPLRERGSDILLLADYFLKKYSEGKRLSSEAKNALFQHDWPGNVRELKNRIQKAIAMSSDNLISAGDLGLETKNSYRNKSSLRHAKQDVEKEYLITALRNNKGNITHTARELGTHRIVIRRLMKKYGISKEKFMPSYKGQLEFPRRNIMSKLKILVVESDKALRIELVWHLKKHYEVFEAADRHDALTYLKKEKRPDVILLELYLPPRRDTLEDGFYVLQKFKERIPEAKVVIITTATEKEVMDKAKEEGADAYLQKPFELEELEDTIEELSQSVPQGKERRKYWRDDEGKGIGVEKRKQWRVSCELPIQWVLVEGESSLKGETNTIDISYSGVSFPVETPIAPNSVLDMKLSLPSHLPKLVVKAVGVVRWLVKLKNEYTYRLGVEFVEMKYAHRKAIADYIYKL